VNMRDLDDLYRETILAHAQHPSNMGPLPDAGASAEGNNPICGDEVALQIAFDGDRIRAARFQGRGCAISQASASMLTEAVAERTLPEVENMIDGVERLLRGEAVEGIDAGRPRRAAGCRAISGAREVRAPRLEGIAASPQRPQASALTGC
jgi:nitrogen fixation protein NifU and related proteins